MLELRPASSRLLPSALVQVLPSKRLVRSKKQRFPQAATVWGAGEDAYTHGTDRMRTEAFSTIFTLFVLIIHKLVGFDRAKLVCFRRLPIELPTLNSKKKVRKIETFLCVYVVCV